MELFSILPFQEPYAFIVIIQTLKFHQAFSAPPDGCNMAAGTERSRGDIIGLRLVALLRGQ